MMNSTILTAFKPSKLELEKFLGPLEVTVLRVVWRGKKTVRAIHKQILREDGDYADSTIRTIVDRLVKRKLLIRRKVEGIYQYTPSFPDEKSFLEASIRLVLLSIIEDYPKEFYTVIAPMLKEASK